MVLQREAAKNQRAHVGNTFQNDPPYGLPSTFPFPGFILLWVVFSHKHLTLVIPLNTTNGLNSILEPMDSTECETVAISMRPTRSTTNL